MANQETFRFTFACYSGAMRNGRRLQFFIMSGAFAFLGLIAAIGQERAGSPAPVALDSSELNRQLIEREAKINLLSRGEQELLRAAQAKASQDPDVKAAMAKRNRALEEYRDTLRASLLNIDPSLASFLDRAEVADR